MAEISGTGSVELPQGHVLEGLMIHGAEGGIGGVNLFNSASGYTKTFTGSANDEYVSVNTVISGVSAVLNAHKNEVLTFSADAVSDVPKTMYLYTNRPPATRNTYTLGNTPMRINIQLTITGSLPTFTLGSFDKVATTVTISNVQIEAGSTASPYAPYGSIGLYADDQLAPIDLGGNVLGASDALTIGADGHATINGVTDLGYVELPDVRDASTLSVIADVEPEIEVSTSEYSIAGGGFDERA